MHSAHWLANSRQLIRQHSRLYAVGAALEYKFLLLATTWRNCYKIQAPSHSVAANSSHRLCQINARCLLVADPRAIRYVKRRSTSTRPKLLCKSLDMLRAKLHQNQVATISKVLTELQRLLNRNAATVMLLKHNPLWNRAPAAEQLSILRYLSAAS